jgi:hypothetical protein
MGNGNKLRMKNTVFILLLLFIVISCDSNATNNLRCDKPVISPEQDKIFLDTL